MKASGRLVPSRSEVAAQLVETVPFVMDVIRAHASADGLTLSQLRALGYADRHPGAPLSDLAAHAGVSLPAASQLVDGLERDGLLKRAPAASDRRRVALTLTARGRKALALARAAAA